MRRLLVSTALVLCLTACPESKAPSPPKAPADPPPITDPSAVGLKDLLDRGKSEVATLAASPQSITNPVIGALNVTITNTSGPTATPKKVRTIPEKAPITATLTGCDQGIIKDANCLLTITISAPAPGLEAAVIVEGANMNPVSVNLSFPGEQRRDEALPAPSDPEEPLRQALLAHMANTSPFPPSPEGLPNTAQALRLQPGVPINPTMNPMPQQIFTPKRDLSRTVTPADRIVLTLNNTILTTRQGQFRARLQYPVHGAFVNGRFINLLPQGTWFLGTYNVVDAVQGRVELRIVSIIDPSTGRTMNVQPLLGYDAMGRAGTPAEIDNRISEMAAGKLLAALVAVAPAYIAPDLAQTTQITSYGTTTSSSTRAEAVGQLTSDLRQILQQAVSESIDTSRRAGIGEGSTIVISPATDWLIFDDDDPTQYARWVSTLPTTPNAQQQPTGGTMP